MTDTTQLFAILADEDRSVRRLPISQPLQGKVRELFAEQATRFRPNAAEVLDFDPSLRPDEEQVIRIPSFTTPHAIATALANPLATETLKVTTSNTDRVAGLFTGAADGQRVYLQVFERRQLLVRGGLVALFDGESFQTLADPVLSFDTKLAAEIVGTNLYFRSYAAAKRILDLTSFYSEATEKEISEFHGHASLYCDNGDALLNACDSWCRRKINVLLNSDVLASITAAKVRSVATRFDVSVAITRIGGKDRIVLPTVRKDLKSLLRLLDGDYYESPLTKARFLSHSKQRLQS